MKNEEPSKSFKFFDDFCNVVVAILSVIWVIAMAIVTAEFWVPFALLFGVSYGIYRLVRLLRS